MKPAGRSATTTAAHPAQRRAPGHDLHAAWVCPLDVNIWGRAYFGTCLHETSDAILCDLKEAGLAQRSWLRRLTGKAG
jgi:hypothetical protein